MIIDEAKRVNAELAGRLRRLADVLEHEEAPDLGGYAGLHSDGQITINEPAFRKWFAGQSVSGRKDGCIITASAEACGVTLEAVIYDPEDSRVRDVIIQL